MTSFIAYVVQRFPALRTTFVRREIEALRELGLPLQVFSMRPVDRTDIEGELEAARHLRITHYLPTVPVDRESIVANLAWAVRHPLRYLRNCITLGLSNTGNSGRVRLWLQVWRGAVMATRLQRLGRCEHVHAQFADGAATTALACARLLGIGFSFTSHTSHDAPALRPKLREARFIASISEYDRQQLIAAGDGSVSERTHIVRCGIPVSDWEFQPNSELSDPVRLLSVGALVETKGHDILIRACHILKGRGVNIRCTIIGAGHLGPDLQRLIDELRVQDEVLLAGPLPQRRVRSELRSAGAFVLACRRAANGDTEGIPVSLMEAMAAGVPVVSTRISGVPELIQDHVTGFLAEPGCPTALAAAISNCLGADQCRSAIRQAARLTIERQFNQRSEAEKLAALVKASISRCQGSSISLPAMSLARRAPQLSDTQ